MDRACSARHCLLGSRLSRVRRGVFTALIVLVCVCSANNETEERTTEYRVKRAFVVNFLKFVEWPETSTNNTDQPFVIAIIGKIPLPEGSSNISDVEVNQKRVVMTIQHQWNPNSESQKRLFEQCGVLFITKSEEKSTSELLATVKQRSVLTVGETADFLEKGGIINFEVVDNKVRFSVHLKHAKEANLEIRSKLLRLAKEVDEN